MVPSEAVNKYSRGGGHAVRGSRGRRRTNRLHHRDRRRFAHRPGLLRGALIRCRRASPSPPVATAAISATFLSHPSIWCDANSARAVRGSVAGARVRFLELRLVGPRRHLLGLQAEDLVLALEVVVLLAEGVALGDESAVLGELDALFRRTGGTRSCCFCRVLGIRCAGIRRQNGTRAERRGVRKRAAWPLQAGPIGRVMPKPRGGATIIGRDIDRQPAEVW